MNAPKMQTIGKIKERKSVGFKSIASKSVGSSTVHVYAWNEASQQFEKSGRTLPKGSIITAASPTVDPEFAWITEFGGTQSYVHKSHVEIDTWGPVKNQHYTGQYFDRNNLLQSATGARAPMPMADTNREWFLDQAVYMEALEKLERLDPAGQNPKVQETKKRLALAMLQAFAKSAPQSKDNGGSQLGMQQSPVLGNQEANYHRSGAGKDSNLLQLLHKSLGASMNLDGYIQETTSTRIHAVADSTVLEVLAREFPVYGVAHPGAGAVKFVDPNIDSVAKFTSSIDALIDNFAAGHAPQGTFVFDLSKLYASLSCAPDQIQDQISRPLEAIFTRMAAAAMAKDSKLASGAIASSLMDKIQLVAHTRCKNTDVLLAIPFFTRMTPEQQQQLNASGDELELRSKVNHDTRDRFIAYGTHDATKLESSIVSSGARIDPIAAKRALLDVQGPEQLLKTVGAHQVRLGTKGGDADLVVCSSLTELLKHPSAQKFATLPQDATTKRDEGMPARQPPAPYLTFYPQATFRLLQGLAAVRTPEGTIDDIFASRQLTSVLQTGYYRVLEAMKMAHLQRDQMIPFLNQIETIHDQMQMILAIAAPYTPSLDFARGILASLKATDGGGGSVMPDGVSASVSHKASAMHSVASIMSSVEAQKEADQGNRNVNALVLRDNYYESAGALHEAKTYDVTSLDGDKQRAPQGQQPAPIKNAMAGADGAPKQPRGPLDLFVCDFHHNISLDRTHYRVEDVETQVAALLAEKLVAPKFTVAIDCTVDFLRSDDIRKFLHRFKNEIAAGTLCVVLFRSAQKFDMLGMDNYYGGYTVTINDGSSFAAFDARISKQEDQVDGLAHQGMAHLATQGELGDQYRKLLMDNTKLLYGKLPKTCKYAAGSDSPFQVALTEDPNAAFLDIQFGHFVDTDVGFSQAFAIWARKEGLALTSRPSFGFATSNLTAVEGKARLNPGLESADAIAKYAAYFDRAQRALAKAQTEKLAGRAYASLTDADKLQLKEHLKAQLAAAS